jgi:hypothetical protein
MTRPQKRARRPQLALRVAALALLALILLFVLRSLG